MVILFQHEFVSKKSVQIDGRPIEKVERYVYLGNFVRADALSCNIQRCISKLYSQYHNGPIWKIIFGSMIQIIPILLYVYRPMLRNYML